MPTSAPTPCRYPSCRALLSAPGFCNEHRAAVHREYGRARRGFDTERGFYQSPRWRSVRAAFLREHPVCKACEALGSTTPGVVADHIQPIKENGLRFDWSNLQALCVSCHNRKTARETAASRLYPPRGA
jgi:5-methylcytosine-specific restriction protein A